jgi:hypothetical protein
MNDMSKEQNQNRKKIYIKNLDKLSIDHWSNSEIIKKVTDSLQDNVYPDADISELVAKKVKKTLDKTN